MSDSCVCMRDVISEFYSEIEGSLAFCALMSDRVGLPPHKTPFPGCPSWRQPHAWDAISNSSKYNIRAGTQLIQLCNMCVQFLHKTETLINALNCPLVASYDIPG